MEVRPRCLQHFSSCISWVPHVALRREHALVAEQSLVNARVQWTRRLSLRQQRGCLDVIEGNVAALGRTGTLFVRARAEIQGSDSRCH